MLKHPDQCYKLCLNSQLTENKSKVVFVRCFKTEPNLNGKNRFEVNQKDKINIDHLKPDINDA